MVLRFFFTLIFSNYIIDRKIYPFVYIYFVTCNCDIQNYDLPIQWFGKVAYHLQIMILLSSFKYLELISFSCFTLVAIISRIFFPCSRLNFKGIPLGLLP